MFFRKKSAAPAQQTKNAEHLKTEHDDEAIDHQKLINTVNHLAVIMDGNGRWAQKRNLPRVMGHVRGVQTVRKLVKNCIKYQIKSLTLFAFSSENWRRPAEEVNFLMRLFTHTLKREFIKLYENNIHLNLIGDLSVLDISIQNTIQEILNSKTKLLQPVLILNIAINYGGQNDIVQALKTHLLTSEVEIKEIQKNQEVNKLEKINENQNQQYLNLIEKIRNIQSIDIEKNLALNTQAMPDLMIRTGGEQRISNFLLWQLAYAELYFTNCFWPAFDEAELCKALHSYQKRERRFGHTSAQISEQQILGSLGSLGNLENLEDISTSKL